MRTSSEIKIKALRPWQVTTLYRLFITALDADFTFIDPVNREQIKLQNSRAHLAATVLRHHRHIFLAWHNSEAVGYIIAGTDVDKSGNIDWLYVKPDQRSHNIGLKLLSRMMRRLRLYGADHVTLVTYAYTNYYRRQGFKVVRRVASDGIEQDLMKYEYFDDQA